MRLVCLLIFTTTVAVASAGAGEIRLLPGKILLQGPNARQRILAEHFEGEDAVGPADVQLRTEDPGIAVIEDGILLPRANGTTVVKALVDGAEQSRVTVHVTRFEEAAPWSFRNHVEPVLTRLGCNSGACHGALAGKGGFRLSLRGYDPAQDYFNIAKQQLGRRIDPVSPGHSLVLTKPTAAVAHKGGKRMDEDSLNYQVISQWIAAGAPGPGEDAELEQLTILPEQATLTSVRQQPLLVMARYSDGTVADVTHWSKFNASNEAVARVDDHGLVSVVGSGEGAVTALFGSQIVIARITVPFEQTVDPVHYAESSRRNLIDDLVLAKLQQLNLQPSGRCDDATFIRRVFLDTIGVLPTSEEVRQFLASDDSSKRDLLIEHLLERPEFVDYWTYQWSDVLMINGNLLRQEPVKAYYQWVRGHVEQNTPWDRMVRELVTSKGSSIENGATNFYALHQKPEDMAENVSQAFLGLSIGCARCHNHPLEKWTNDQYYAFANLFSRVRAKGWGGDSRNGDGKRTLVTVSSGELVQPRTGRPQLPTPLDGSPLALDDTRDRREYMADWLVSDDNTLFARSITNRVWRNFMGVGLVEQVDDMRASNPASNEELLAALAAYLVEQNYDLKSLMRLILQSETWQRSSETLETNKGDKRFYSRCFPRRLMAEVMLDAISQATSVPTEFTQIGFPGGDFQKTNFYEEGTRAIQLYDSAVDSYFLKTFGRNQRRITCECERSNDPSMVQVLHISNGRTLNEKLQAEDNSISHWSEQFAGDDAALLDEMFLTSLSRFPQEHEKQELLNVLAETSEEDRRVVLEDILWSMLSSREFLFTH